MVRVSPTLDVNILIAVVSTVGSPDRTEGNLTTPFYRVDPGWDLFRVGSVQDTFTCNYNNNETFVHRKGCNKDS